VTTVDLQWIAAVPVDWRQTDSVHRQRHVDDDDNDDDDDVIHDPSRHYRVAVITCIASLSIHSLTHALLNPPRTASTSVTRTDCHVTTTQPISGDVVCV